MFNSARIKLTAWYSLIIMFISISFSVGMYKVLASELDRVERIQRFRIEHRLPEESRIETFDIQTRPPRPSLDPDLIDETKNRLIIILGLINLAILAASAGSGYFLAGRTLRPIKEMVDEQNRFITDSSHELRTPLTSLKSEIEVNLRNKKLTLEEAKKLLKSNLEEVNSLQVLSDGLIKLTQYQKGTNSFSVTEISLSSVVNEAVKKVNNLAKNKKIAIENKIKDYKIEANIQALTELFVIFLDNSIKYSKEKTKIILTSQKSEGYVSVQIRDEGMGIEKEEIPHLFDRFYRVDKSRTKSDIQGYGLGLSIAKQIIEKHNGSIKVESKINKGTIFTVQIPYKHFPKLI